MKCSLACVLGFAVLMRFASAQTETLADYVMGLNWDPAKRGVLMVLDPGGVPAKASLDGLAAFGMTRTSVLGLSAIIPDTMVVIDDSLQQAPNMYDGLPRHSKVLYLMTTLDNQQWEAITGPGLGIGQLNKDQQAVFNSIIPKPFAYTSLRVNDDFRPEQVDASVELSDTDTQSIRLHIDRSLIFMMPIVGQPNSRTARFTRQDYGKPGDKVIERKSEGDFKNDAFFLKIRQTVPNLQKPSDLDFRSSSLVGAITLNATEKISDLLKRISEATQLELHADFRVGDLEMESIGRSAPIASVLKVIALSVTGTYRRVGSAYILTSDLVGMGTRKMKIAEYDYALNTKVRNKETTWRQQIFKSGHLNQIRFRGDDSLAPSDILAKKLDVDSPGPLGNLTSSDLTPVLTDFLRRQNQIYKTQPVTVEGAAAKSEFEFSYILPNGENTRPDMDTLGQQDMFARASSGSNLLPEPPPVPKVNAAEIKEPIFLCSRADSASEAKQIVDLAAKFGIEEIWLDTFSQGALNEAIKDASRSQIKIALAIQPFAYRGQADAASADRTLFGDTPPESLARRMADPDWQVVLSRQRQEPESVGCISPLSSVYQARQAAVRRLAATSGLVGIHLMSPTPNGYNGLRVNYMSFPQPHFLEKRNFGYAEDLRLQFIREKSIDPIDLSPGTVYTNSDIYQPFFMDNTLRGMRSIYDSTDSPNPGMAEILNTFDTWLAELNQSSIANLLTSIAIANPKVPITTEPIPIGLNAVNRPSVGSVEWAPGDPLPKSAESSPGTPQPDLGKVISRIWVTEVNPLAAQAALNYLASPSTKRQKTSGVIMDMTLLTMKQIEKWLNETFVQRLANQP